MNNRIYIGKRTSRTHPLKDGYYGSGKLIKAAIKKYGKDTFSKEILHFCDSLDEMNEIEASIVTEEFVHRVDTYNMHKGGKGGWEHINSVPKEERINVKAFLEKKANGTIKYSGGPSHWTEESYRKCVNQARINSANGCGRIFWETASDDRKRERLDRIREAATGEGNSQYGTHVYIDKNYSGPTPPSTILGKSRYKEGSQPLGWIPISEWMDNKKDKKRVAYGNHWYNNDTQNFFLSPNNPLTSTLKRGRINIVE